MQSGSTMLFLCGDVMTGRGIDQILPHPCEPHLYEPYAHSAAEYVALAEQASGAWERPVGFAYIWGEALAELERRQPDARIINLESAVTVSEDAWPGKSIHYRMSPANLPCIAAAHPDCCVLANNHVMDWGYRGLDETLDALRRTGIRSAGAGRDRDEAAAPATIDLGKGGRVVVYAFATESSGVPGEWAARKCRPGVSVLNDLSSRAVQAIARKVEGEKRAGDVTVLSIHWGGNWGFEIGQEERAFAHRLIDAAGVDLVHGHSSHHVKGIEVYRGKPVIYGCGDFLNDYEGISGHERYRPDLSLMYFPVLDSSSGRLVRFVLAPTRIHQFRIISAPEEGIHWLMQTLNREGAKLGTRVERDGGNDFLVQW